MSNSTRRRKAQPFILSLGDDEAITRAANSGYLAALLDRGHVGVDYSKKDRRPLRVRIQLGESHGEAEDAWRFIGSYWNVKASVRPQNLADSPSIREAEAKGVRVKNTRTTWYFRVSDPRSVLTLGEAALHFSERKERLQEVIEACKYLLSQNEAKRP